MRTGCSDDDMWTVRFRQEVGARMCEMILERLDLLSDDLLYSRHDVCWILCAKENSRAGLYRLD